eukprot:TRINITY_DN2416_c0_g1_i1.p1 TRINITY_DN2416_c0_g1~~TRINITY_DN2416_c0_g1_i1.p1  ORF type:complete len:121 (+),score=27.35 TRINITY_DN2416_c0_g1_i1:31-363(+)
MPNGLPEDPFVEEHLFGCMKDIQSCLIGMCFPNFLIAKTTATVNGDATCSICDCLCSAGNVATLANRMTLKSRMHAEIDFLQEAIMAFGVCSPCATCQTYRVAQKVCTVN